MRRGGRLPDEQPEAAQCRAMIAAPIGIVAPASRARWPSPRPSPAGRDGLDSLDSQTKCNTRVRCCLGRHYTQLSIEDRCELARLHAQGASLRQIATALDRAPSNEYASRATSPAMPRSRPAPGAGAAPVSTGMPRSVAGAARLTRLVAGADRWPAPAGGGPDRHRPRDHLSLHLRPDHPHQAGPGLASLPPPRQVAPGLARAPGRQRRHPHPPPAAPGRTDRFRPPDPGPLGSRSDALPHLWPSR